ncbi:MAG TPA: hypothetical protein VGR27_07725 [Longimicrobiaceae bacterium]|nr:hypothetical protein [Longimicrobiaceae bacterium]
MTNGRPDSPPPVAVGMNVVVVAVTEGDPRILTLAAALEGSVLGEPLDALPFAPLEPERDPTLELGLRTMVREQAGLELGYVEQLYTFGDRYRDPAERRGRARAISVAYLALVREGEAGRHSARWTDAYGYFPWEDWREGRPGIIEREIALHLDEWTEATQGSMRQQRRERVEITFGLGGAPWDAERVLERYELLYEVGLVDEAARDRADTEPTPAGPGFGRPMALDHRRMLAAALGRLRGKLKYRPVVFELLPPTFTLLQLQQVVEALAGVRLHKANFRRLLESAGLVEGMGEFDTATGGRPAELFRFRRDVLRERPAPGVGLPGTRAGSGG